MSALQLSRQEQIDLRSMLKLKDDAALNALILKRDALLSAAKLETSRQRLVKLEPFAQLRLAKVERSEALRLLRTPRELEELVEIWRRCASADSAAQRRGVLAEAAATLVG